MPSGTRSACGFTRREILNWGGHELVAAAGRAEVIDPSSVVGSVLCGVRIDIHAADGIFGHTGAAGTA